MDDRLIAQEAIGCSLGFNPPPVDDAVKIHGWFTAVCRDKDGNELWHEEFPNTVVTVGVNAMLDAALAGSAYTVTGPFMGLISATPTTANADTMASHAGWTEVGLANAPTYSVGRKTCAWSAASARAKALSAGLVFTFTGSGTVGGAFIVYGSGAVATIDNTSGTLFSAGAFTGGNQAVVSTNTITVSYTVTVT